MSKEPEYDIVVIGGGATGCGVAADAASRGAFWSDDLLHAHRLCLL